VAHACAVVAFAIEYSLSTDFVQEIEHPHAMQLILTRMHALKTGVCPQLLQVQNKNNKKDTQSQSDGNISNTVQDNSTVDSVRDTSTVAASQVQDVR
jgi:Tfp pilus assembly protein FimT